VWESGLEGKIRFKGPWRKRENTRPVDDRLLLGHYASTRH
jgi:hypothetical protein